MLKKIFFLLSILLLITGCDAIYSLNLENNKFQENLEISEKYNSHEITNFKEIVDVAVTGAITLDYRDFIPESNIKEENINYYEISKYSTNDLLGIKYFGHFDLEELKYSNIIFSNAENYNINSNKDKIIIRSGDLNTFIQNPTLENLTIKFSTNHQVYKNNADKKNDNIYYWYFTKDNIAEKIIELEISKDPKKVELDALELGEDGYFGSRTLYLLYATIGVVLLISAGYIYIKIKKANN